MRDGTDSMKITESKLRRMIREMIREGFAGPLPKAQQKKFETERKRNSEVLGYTLTGTPDRKTDIGLTEAKMVTLIIPAEDKRKADQILKQLKMNPGKQYKFNTGKNRTFELEVDSSIENKILDAFIENGVDVKG